MSAWMAWARAEMDAALQGAVIARYARQIGAPGGARVVEGGPGRLEVTEDDGCAIFALSSGDAAGLAHLRRALGDALSAPGLAWDWMEDLTDRRPGNLSVATVAAVIRLSPSFSRVVLEGADLMRFAEGGLHFRLLFGPKGAPWPSVDAAGQVSWPGGLSAWHRPVYTLRRIEPVPGGARLSFDVFRHAGGRVTAWCDRVQPGAQIALTGPGGGGLPEPAARVGMVGDETAIPVIARMLEALPGSTLGRVILHVPSAEDRQPLRHPPGVAVAWRTQARRSVQDDLEEVWSGPGCTLFYAGERGRASSARDWMKGQGVTRRDGLAAAYWSA